MKMTLAGLLATLTAATAFAVSQPAIKGDYLEVRSCDIYTGPCFANAEMGTAGKEAMLVWSVKEGSWQGTSLDGLTTVNLDFTRLYRPQTNVVARPVLGIGKGYSLVGHHEIMIPLLAAALVDA